VGAGLCSDYGASFTIILQKGGRREGETWHTLRRSLFFGVLTTVAGWGVLPQRAAWPAAVCRPHQRLPDCRRRAGDWPVARWVERQHRFACNSFD